MRDYDFEDGWASRAAEAELVSEYRAKRSVKRAAGRMAALGFIGAVVIGLANPLLLILGLVIGAFSMRTRHKASVGLEQIRSEVNRLRTIPNPEFPMIGDTISMVPHPLGLSAARLLGRVLDGDENGGIAVVLSEPLDETEYVGKVEGSFFLRRDELAVYALEGGEALIYDRQDAKKFAELWEPVARASRDVT